MGIFRLSIELSQSIDQRALPRSRRAGQPDYPRVAGVRKQGFQQIRPSGRTILDGRDGASQYPRIARAQGINLQLKIGIRGSFQATSVKQECQRKTYAGV